jgi:two-component system, NarL family, response regulator NreC
VIRVVLADEHRLFRQGVSALLQGAAGISVVAEATDGPSALERVLVLTPEVAVLSVSLPALDGLETTRRIVSAPSSTQVVLLADRRQDTEPRRAFEAGATGYLTRQASFEDLVRTVRKVARGDLVLVGAGGDEPGREELDSVLSRRRAGGAMTARERQVAVLLADGYSTREAAAALGISVRTAETHRASILHKLAARNVADIVKYCIRNRLIDF